jgi:hypothetical protein
MLKKNKKEKAGPGWAEVILGAILAVALGVVLGAAYMVNLPVKKVTSIPKDAPSGAVFYIEGSKDMSTAGVTEKRRLLDAGETVEVDEGEMNALFGTLVKASAPAPAPSKPGDKTPPPPAADAKILETSALNARIHDQKIQFGDTATLSLFGITDAVIVQATGTFEKGSSGYEFEPETILVGGCPVQRLIFLRGWIMNKLLFTSRAPDDLAAAWSKLSDVSIDGTKLRLKSP